MTSEHGTNQELHVLLIAYACEPNRGSEPGTGWNTSVRLAARDGYKVTVVTRANNQTAIELALKNIEECRRPNFVFLDPPPWTRWLKKRGVMPIQIFYYFWQRTVARKLQQRVRSYDIIHQLTFNSFEVPPLAFSKSVGAKVWGPVGGGQQVSTANLEDFGPAGAGKELWRNRRVRFSSMLPWVRQTLGKSDLVLFANAETHQLLAPHCNRKTSMMVDVGVDVRKFEPPRDRSSEGPITVLAAGRLEPRKGIVLLVDAFAEIRNKRPDLYLKLRIVGDGPEHETLKARVGELGLDASVTFAGAVNHDEMRREFEQANVFVFPSLRDTSGAVVLEAMAMALPVVCFDHQGAALMVEEGCGIKVPVGSPGEMRAGLGKAILSLAEDSLLRRNYGFAGRSTVESKHDWDVKVTQLEGLYQSMRNTMA